VTILADAISRAIDDGLMVPEPILCAEWVKRFGWTSGQSAVPGPYDMSRTPYVAEILNAVDDPRVRQITIIKGSQVGMTELYIQILGYMIDRRPRTTMVVFPTADTASEANKDRITPALAGMPPIRHSRLKEVRKDGSARVVRYKTMTVFYRGANSKRQTETIPAGVVIGDELDRCPPGTAHLLRQRGKTYNDFKLILLGKPEIEGTGIDFEYANSDRRQLYLPCPECGDWHTRRFSRVRWYGKQRDGTDGPDSRDFNADATQAEQTARYKCGNCHTLIGPESNQWQLHRGVWCPTGAKIAGEPDAGRVEWIDGGRPVSSNRGYHIPEFVSGLIPNPYAPAARGFVERKGVIDQDFANDHEGRAWKFSVGNKADVRTLKERIDQAHKLGTVPPEVVALVACADIQHFNAYMIVLGFSAKMERCWLIWHERVPCPIGDRLVSMHGAFARRFRRTDGRDMAISARGVDSGEGERTKEIYEYCSNAPYEVYATKAFGIDRSGNAMDKPHDVKEISAKYAGGKKGIKLVKIKSHLWKQECQRAMGLMQETPTMALPDDDAEVVQQDAARATEAGKHAIVFPGDVPDYVLQQLSAEECVKVQDTKRGGLVYEYKWRLREGHPENHYFDAMVYAYAVAHARGWKYREEPIGLVGGNSPTVATTPKPSHRQQGPNLIEMARGQSLIPPHRR